MRGRGARGASVASWLIDSVGWLWRCVCVFARCMCGGKAARALVATAGDCAVFAAGAAGGRAGATPRDRAFGWVICVARSICGGEGRLVGARVRVAGNGRGAPSGGSWWCVRVCVCAWAVVAVGCGRRDVCGGGGGRWGDCVCMAWCVCVWWDVACVGGWAGGLWWRWCVCVFVCVRECLCVWVVGGGGGVGWGVGGWVGGGRGWWCACGWWGVGGGVGGGGGVVVVVAVVCVCVGGGGGGVGGARGACVVGRCRRWMARALSVCLRWVVLLG